MPDIIVARLQGHAVEKLCVHTKPRGSTPHPDTARLQIDSIEGSAQPTSSSLFQERFL